MDLLLLFFQLIIGHCVGDFVLQPTVMSRAKNPDSNLQNEYGDGFPTWHYWLGAHALTHSGIIFLITGSTIPALLEAVLHALIDTGKCKKLYNIHVDQALHVLSKILYCLLIYAGLS